MCGETKAVRYGRLFFFQNLELFEKGEKVSVTDAFQSGVPVGWCSDGKGSAPQADDGGQSVSIGQSIKDCREIFK